MSEPKEQPKKRERKLRFSYREHSPEAVEQAIRAAVREPTGVFQDWLTQRCLEAISEPTDFERGVREGRRQLAGQILNIALGNDSPAEE